MTLLCLLAVMSLMPISVSLTLFGWAMLVVVALACSAPWMKRNKARLAYKLYQRTHWGWTLNFLPVSGGTTGPNETIASTTRTANLEAVCFQGGISTGPPLAQGALAFSPVSVYSTTAPAITVPPGSFSNPETTAVSSAADISGTTVLAATLAAPIAGPTSLGGQDGVVLVIFNDTPAKAHTITTSANIINGNQSIITMSSTSATLSSITLMAYNGIWWVLSNVNCTLSGT
jgi:hypothetical protein